VVLILHFNFGHVRRSLGSVHFLGGRGGLKKSGVRHRIFIQPKSRVGHNFFSLEPNKDGSFILIIRGPCLSSKLTKGGPGELKYMLMGIPSASLPLKK